MRKSKYIKKPIKHMEIYERLDLAQSMVDGCGFPMTIDEQVDMIKILLSAMYKMEPYQEPPEDEITTRRDFNNSMSR